MSKKIISYVITLAMIFSVLCNPALGHATTEAGPSNVTNITAAEEPSDDTNTVENIEEPSDESDLPEEEVIPEDDSIEIGVVTNLTASAASCNTIGLKWREVEGATGYQIYRYSKAKAAYVYLTTVSGTSYKNTKLTGGTVYNYKVKACVTVDGKTKTGDFSAKVTCKTLPYIPVVKGVSAKANAYNAITVKWNKVSGAKGYQVYRYSAKKKKYILFKTVTANSYKNIKLKSATSYSYKVRAYKVQDGKNFYGKFSPVVKCKTLPYIPVVKGVSAKANGDDAITVTWKKVSGAKGYQVYRYSTIKKKYVLYKTLTGCSYKNTKLLDNTRYYYKVRAYKVQNGENYFGEFSEVIKCRTEKTDQDKIKELAYSKRNCPYRWGAKGPKSFDCSGFVYWVYKNADVSVKKKVPRTSAAGMYYSLKKYMIGSSIKSLNKAEVGDIIFFKRGGRVCHVGIYYGDGNMINAANARRDICIESVRDWNSWGYKVVGIARVLKD